MYSLLVVVKLIKNFESRIERRREAFLEGGATMIPKGHPNN